MYITHSHHLRGEAVSLPLCACVLILATQWGIEPQLSGRQPEALTVILLSQKGDGPVVTAYVPNLHVKEPLFIILEASMGVEPII